MFRIKALKKKYIGLLMLGALFTLLKVAIVIQHFGVPNSLHYLYTVKIAYLKGDLRFPAAVEFFGRYPLLSACMLAAFIYQAKGTLWPFMCALMLLFANNLAIGSRGDFGLALVLYLATLLVLAYIKGSSITQLLLDRRLLIPTISVLVVVVIVFVGRHGYSVRHAIDDLILYFAGNIPATVYVLQMAYDGQLPSRGPVMTMGGILRLFTDILGSLGISMPALPVDFGYVPVYSNLDYGMNTYTYIAYLVGDWGLVGSLIASFLIGFIGAYSLIRVKVSGGIFWMVTSIMMVTLLLTSLLYLASKLISWWMTWLLSYWCVRGCVSVRKACGEGL